MSRRTTTAILAAGLLALAACSGSDGANANAGDAASATAGNTVESVPGDEIAPVDGDAGLTNDGNLTAADTPDANLSDNAADPVGNSL